MHSTRRIFLMNLVDLIIIRLQKNSVNGQLNILYSVSLYIYIYNLTRLFCGFIKKKLMVIQYYLAQKIKFDFMQSDSVHDVMEL